MTIFARASKCVLLAGVLGCCFLPTASAAIQTLDLTDHVLPLPAGVVAGEINGAWFTRDTSVLSGTGVFGTFVRIQANGNATVEEGYNTSARKVVFDEDNSIHTHDITAGQIPIVEYVVGGVTKEFFEFLLDINEPASEKGKVAQNFLSLDDVQIYTSPTNFSDGNNPTDPADLGTLVYAMDTSTDNWEVLLDYNVFGKGSGRSDMRLLLPISTFTDPDDFVYLYSHFGAKGEVNGEDYGVNRPAGFTADAGFEEWATREGEKVLEPPITTDDVVPEPASCIVWGIGLVVGLFVCGRRRKK